jgi:2-enoate reductase
MANLFSGIKIGNMRVKNRIAMAPMHTNYESDGAYPMNAIRYFEERAKGGAGLIFTGANVVSTKYDGKRPSPEISGLNHVERLEMIADRVHAYDAKLCVQLSPGAGRVAVPNPASPPYSASAVPEFWAPMITTQVLSVEDIHHLADRVGFAAWLVKKAGGDMVELHSYGGYLLDQFMSTQWNQREDEYGGSLENRMRFPIECIQAIRKYTGGKMPISVKFTVDQGVEGWRTIEEGIEIAKMFEAAGADLLHVDRGVYECWYKAIPTVYQEHAYAVDLLKQVKEAVSIPVMGHGKLHDPDDALGVVADGIVDIVGIGHQMIADPYWAKKMKEEKYDEIRPCIGCNECLNSAFNGTHPVCSVNPLVCEEDAFALPAPDGTKRKVLVIGAGPGGMEAAITAAERGFDVELWESADKVGGALLAAGAPDFKADVMKLVKYMESQMQKLGVKVVLGKEATVENVTAGEWDKVIVATGAHSVLPPIKGIEKAQESISYLIEGKKPGENTVVIGGGMVGCEVAAYMAEFSGNVTVVEMLKDILLTADHCKNNDQALRAMLDERGVKKVCSAKVAEITDSSVIYEDAEGNTAEIPADTVIISAGRASSDSLADQLDGKVDLSVIGDANDPAKVMFAVRQGYNIIRTME